MYKYRASVSRLAVISMMAMLAAQAACRDTPTAPRPHENAQMIGIISTPVDSSSGPEIVFLPPFGPRHSPKGELDTTLAPSVSICRLAGDHCTADTVARFTSDSSAPDTRRVQLTDKAYVVPWNVSKLDPDTAAAFRVTVMLGDTTVGYTDAKLVRVDDSSADIDTARFSLLTERRMLRIRFQIFMPPELLTVITEPGVHGSPASGTTPYRRGERVAYQFEADSGYTNVLVTVDQAYLPRRGRVLMNRHHVLVASADRSATVAAGDEWMLTEGRALLRSGTPVQAAQRFLDRVNKITDTVNLTERLKRVDRVLSDADPVALRSLDLALAGHAFVAGTGHGSDDPVVTPPPFGGGGGVFFNRLVPLSAPRAASLLPARSIGTPGTRIRYEPLTIGYVNGVLTTPFGALFSANQLARVASASHWGAQVNFDVRLIYNSTASGSPDDLSDRCVLELAKHSDGLGINALPVYLDQCNHGSATLSGISKILGILGDFAEAGLQLAEILNKSRTIRPADADSVAAITARWRAAGQHVVFVPHSQGNMMVQQGIGLLQRRGNFNPSIDSTCIGAVPVAAPTSDNWPISSRHLTGVVAAHDVILLLGKNRYPQVQTPLSDSADTDARRWHALSLVPGLTGAVRVKWSMRIHEFTRGYLEQEPTRMRIQNALVHAYKSCALGNIGISPERLVVTVGSSGAFSTSLRDLNDEPLEGSRSITWTADASTDLQRAVSILPSGRFRASYVGGTGVHAATSTLIASAGVTVDPAPMAPVVTEALSARWLLLGIGSPPPSSVPSSAPPPFIDRPAPWTGDNCIAKQQMTVADGRVGLFTKQCNGDYDVNTEAVQSAARYEAIFFESNHTNPAFTITAAGPHLRGTIGGPPVSFDLLPGPTLLDRVNVTAWDNSGHMLGAGTACAHGCSGWPGFH